MKDKQKLIYKIAILALLLIISTNIFAQKRLQKKYEKRIIGTWVLEEIELDNIDEIAQSMLDIQTSLLDDQIAQLEEQIKIAENEKDKEIFQTQLDESKMLRSEFTLEKIKEEFNNEFEKMYGEFKLEFTKNKSFKSYPEAGEGTWFISKDGTILATNDGEHDQNFTIIELTDKKLILFYDENSTDMSMKMKMTFQKKIK